MAAVKNIRNNKRYRNYISSLVAINKTGEALEPFTENGLQVIHHQITQKLGNMPPCTHQCSNVERDLNRWCQTCIQWKAELEKWLPFAARRNRVNWSQLHSWQWINHARAIAEVFILPGWDTNNIILKDLSTTLTIWHRCSRFSRQLVTLSNYLRDDRNELAHSPTMSVTTQRKTAIFQHIRNVVNHPDVQQSILNLPDVLQALQELEQGELFHYENDILNALQVIAEQNKNTNTKIDRVALGLTEQRNDLRYLTKKITIVTIGFASLLTLMFSVCLSMFISLQPTCSLIYSNQDFYLALHQQSFTIPRSSSNEGCLSESSDLLPLGNVSLFEYLSHHKKFAGRDWLFRLLRKEVFRDDRHGVLLEAGMGYGKSALMTHIICANNISIYREIREQLVAFHVCRFDVLMSKQVYIFVFRLLSMMARQISKLNDHIKTCQQIFDKSSCEEDPNGCLDHCVIVPLKNIQYTEDKPLVIALDALDECHDSYKKENPIFLLLKHRIHRFPQWIKFLITSRYGFDIRELVKDLALIRLEDDDENNKNDILIYFKELLSNTSTKHVSYDTNNFLIATSVNENNIDNFLLPKTLDRFYDEQFTREFGEGVRSDFDIARCILEVLCSLFQAPEEKLIFKILSYSTTFSEMALNKTLQRLHNFLRIIDGKYFLSHLSVKQWLTNTNNKQFNLNINDGHKINARYFLSKILNDSASVNIVDLCIHVGLSLNTQIKEEFLNLAKIKPAILEHSGFEYPVIELAKRIDSAEVMNLLTSLFKDLDRKGSNSATATFVAASYGHLESMKALLDKGADITTRTDSFKDIINLEVAIEVSFEYQYWGYGILDIAAQNGHSNIVEFILSNNGILFDYPMTRLNSMMLLPIHLACKRGHLEIVQKLTQTFQWMLDWQCLYYASEIGHSNMVEFILNNNVTDECRICKEHLHWIPYDAVRVQGQIVPRNTSDANFVLFDDWLNITCESALHVAVRRERSDIVKLLVKQNTNALTCHDRGGRTPVISAVQYGHQDIVKGFLENGILNFTESCGKGYHLNDSFKLHVNEISKLHEYFCDEAMPLLHVATRFDRYLVFEELTNYNVRINWNLRTIEGCHVLHQAACHSSMKVLFYFKSLNLIGNIQESFYKCQNGSTPLQSAIVCGSVAATEFLLKYSNFDEQDTDIKFSYLKLAVSGDLNGDLIEDVKEFEDNITVISQMLIIDDAILLYKDKMGRNIIHYALSNGHFGVLTYFFYRYFYISHDLLIEKDGKRKTPLQYAIDLMPPRREFHINGTTAFGLQNENIKINANTQEVASPKEYSLITALNFLDRFRKMDSFIDGNTVKTIIKKQCLHVISHILVKSKTAIFESSTLGDILKHDKNGLIMLSYYIVFIRKMAEAPYSGLTEEILKIGYSRTCKTCDEVLNKCYLHKLALAYSLISEVISALKIKILHDLILSTFFRQSDVKTMSTCYDQDGFNVLERAIQSGSPYIVKHLLTLKAESDLEKVQLVEMGLSAHKYRDDFNKFLNIRISDKGNIIIYFITHEELITEMRLTKNFHRSSSIYLNMLGRSTDVLAFLMQSRNESDWHIYQLIREFWADIPRNKVCNEPVSRRFSLVHRIAFEGYTQSLMLIQQFWGSDVLKCCNLDRFTPLYLSMVLNFTDTTYYLENQGFRLVPPYKQAEYYLLSNLVYRFLFSRKEVHCLAKEQATSIKNVYGQIKRYKCLKKVFQIFNFSTLSISFHTDLKYLRLLFTIITQANLWQKTAFLRLNYELIQKRRYVDATLSNVESANTLVSKDKAYFLNLVELEKKTCKYLKQSVSKYGLLILENPDMFKDNPHFKSVMRFLKDNTSFSDFLRDYISMWKNFLYDTKNYAWGFSNCSEIVYDLAEEMTSLCRDNILNNMKKLWQEFRIQVIIQAWTEATMFPFSTKLLKPSSHEVINKIHALFRTYRNYQYIDVLYYSKMYQSSVAYLSKNVNAYSEYTSGVHKAAQFTVFKLNAAKLLAQYLESIREFTKE